MIIRKELTPQIIADYKNGITLFDMAEKYQVSMYYIKNHVKYLLENGEIEKREQVKRKARLDTNYKIIRKLDEEEKKKNHPHPNGGVYCDAKVAKQCVYGMASPGYYYQMLCNYCDIVGHSRGCDPHDCTEFKQITEDNPRQYSKYDNGYRNGRENY